MAYTPEQFATILLNAAREAPGEAKDVVKDNAQQLRGNARRNAAAANPVHARAVPGTINFDVEGGGLSAEIGYDKRGQGNLGAILEYANGGARNSPQRNLGRALDMQEPRFMDDLGDMGERVIE